MTSWKIWRPEESGKAGTRKYGDKTNLEKITLENNSCNTVTTEGSLRKETLL